MNVFRTQLVLLNIIFSLLINSGLFGQDDQPEAPVTLEHSVDRARITIGDLIKYSVIVKHDRDIAVQMPSAGANLGMFEIREYNIADPRRENGQIIEQAEYTISTFETGEFDIPPIGICYTMPGDTTVKELHTESIKIIVESLKPSEEGDIRDIKMPLEIPRNYRQLIFIIVISVLVIVIGILTFLFIKRHREGKSLIPRRVKPQRPPHEVALEDLEKLVASDLLEAGEVKKYYVTISEIIRRYIEGRFFIIALEMTTTQLLDNMRRANIDQEILPMTEEFLDSCDLVKFAKYIPTNEENEQVTQQAFDLVNRTKLVIEEAKEEGDEESAKEIEEPVKVEDVAEETVSEVRNNIQNGKDQ